MLTIFSIPKSFDGNAARHQRNAIRSWRALAPEVEILLFGSDRGTAEAAGEFGAHHFPEVATTTLGTPRLDGVFREAQRVARWPTLLYANADIVFFKDLLDAALAVQGLDRYLVCGRRIDLDMEEDLGTDTDAMERFAARSRREGTVHPPNGSDYFLFPRGLIDLPPFSVGRPGWDNWLMYWAHAEGVPLIDASSAVAPVHQNHDYSHSRFGTATQVRGPEYLENVRLAGGSSMMLDLRAAGWLLGPHGVTRKPA